METAQKSVPSDDPGHNPILNITYGHISIARNTTLTTVVSERHLRQTADPTVLKFFIFNAIFHNWLCCHCNYYYRYYWYCCYDRAAFRSVFWTGIVPMRFCRAGETDASALFPAPSFAGSDDADGWSTPGNARTRQSFCARHAPRGWFTVIIVRTNVRRLLRSPGMECVECNENNPRAYYGTGNGERWLLGRMHLSSRERRRISK